MRSLVVKLLVLLAFSGVAFLSAGSAAAATYGLVIGIDDYIGEANDLAGAVNDANDIAAALDSIGAAEIILLTDEAATKAAIEAAWLHLVARAVAGDTIVFSYAGHGSQEPEPPGRRGEEDGLNENFILAGYQSIGERSGERIVDDEIFAWLQMAEDKAIEVIFIADSCHSGTMYRTIAGDQPTYRLGDFDPPAEPAPLPDGAFAVAVETDFEHVTFIGATEEHRLTPELTIDGVRRGALSWAFARALEGAADTDGDAALTQHELLAYLVPTVALKAEFQQTPTVFPLSPVPKPLIRIAAGTDTVRPAPPIELLTVAILGGGTLPEIAGVALASNENDADLVWDIGTGTVEHRLGGRVAEGIGPDEIGAVLSKWSALTFLESLAIAEPFLITIAEGNGVHRRGEIITLEFSGGTRRYLTLFNLPPNGRIEFLLPANNVEAEEDWRRRTETLQVQVADPPYGAEHLIAILTDERPTALQSALAAMSEDEGAEGLAALLMSLLEAGEVQVGILGIYTAE